MSWSLDGRILRSLLVTRLRYLGDVAMATVVLAVLRRGDPALELGFLCESPYAELLRDHPALTWLHALANRRSSADARARRADRLRDAAAAGEVSGERTLAVLSHGTWGTVQELRRRRYDAAVDLLFNPRSALLLWAAGSRGRIGGSAGSRRRLYTHTAAAPSAAQRQRFRRLARGGLGDHLSRLAPLHHVPTGLSFLDWFERAFEAQPPAPRVVRPEMGGTRVATLLARLGVDVAGGYILFAPGATWPAKEWPTERWQELARLLNARRARQLVLLSPPIGAAAHAALGQLIEASGGGHLPPLGLRDALRVVGAASLLVTVDSGIMHAAVAMGRPTLALFGPSSPDIWFPYEDLGPFRVLCRRPACHPCDRHACDEFVCLPELSAATVATATDDLLVTGAA